MARPTTTDRLRHDIDAGLAGDKVPHADPAAAPLGTDAEASGNPATPEEIRDAVPAPGPVTGASSYWNRHDPGSWLYALAVIVVGCALVGAVVLGAS